LIPSHTILDDGIKRNKMKRIILIITICLFITFIYSRLSAGEQVGVLRYNTYDNLTNESIAFGIKDFISQFSLKRNYQNFFSLKYDPNKLPLVQEKNYWKVGLKVGALNMVVWAYDVFILEAEWAKISLKSILNNFKYGYEWDTNSFKTNQFEHPYHGALHYSVARINGINFWESSIYPFLGSFMWEFFMETNRPSSNDHIMTTLGGIVLGEVLFRFADLAYDENSRGIQRLLRQSLAFVINPIYGFSLVTRKGHKMESPLEEHYYDLNLGFGLYDSFTKRPIMVIFEATLEYNDALRRENSKIKPYDWFFLKFRLEFNDISNFDKEIITTGFLTGYVMFIIKV